MNMSLHHILRLHAGRYPAMGPADAVKLIYQNEFGGGHLIADEDACLARLRAEYEATPQRDELPLTEDLGNGIVRVMLGALDAHGYSPEQLGRDFIRGSNAHKGTTASFLEKLEVLRDVTREGCFSFPEEALESYLTAYIQAGCPAVSHSPEYRQSYQPAYRVVLAELIKQR